LAAGGTADAKEEQMAQRGTPKVYKHRGHTFEFWLLPETGTKLWAADGYLNSDPSVAIRTKTFNTEREAVLAFMDKAKEIANRRKVTKPAK
jgi:hypothetical protein